VTVPDYEIIIAGRMGPLVAFCLPGLRPMVPSATVLHALATSPGDVQQLLAVLDDHRLRIVDVRIDPMPTALRHADLRDHPGDDEIHHRA